MTKKKLPIAEQQVIEDKLNATREKLKIVQNEPYIEHWKNLSLIDINGEIWKDVVGWEGIYQVSNYCRIKSLRRVTKSNKNVEDLILTQIIDNTINYRFINFNSPKAKKYPHRLVAQLFIPNPENLPCVNHINGNPQDCRIINMEWSSKSHNALHMIKIIGKNWSKDNRKIGKDSPYSKKVLQKDLNGEVIKIWECQMDIQKELNIWQTHISKCCRGVKDSAGGYKWEFYNEPTMNYK